MTCHQAQEWTNLLTLAASPSTPVTLLHAIRYTVADDAVEVKEGRMFVCLAREQIILASLQL